MLDDASLANIAQRYGLPPAILKAALTQGQGVPDHAVSTAGFDQQELSGNENLAAEVAARALSQSFTQNGSWDHALAAYFTGNPAVDPNSQGASMAAATIGLSATYPMLDMDRYSGPLNSAMFQDLGNHWNHYAGQGGVISSAQIKEFYGRATEVVQGVHGSSQAGPPGRSGGRFSSIGGSDPHLVGGRSYDSGQCTALAAGVLSWIPEYAGDAHGWINSVPRMVPGSKVSGTPSVGSAVVWQANQGGAAGAGHVGVVVGVNPDGTVQVAQQNWPEGSGPNISTLPKSEAGQLAYISPPPGQAATAQAQASMAAQQITSGQVVNTSQAHADVGIPRTGADAPDTKPKENVPTHQEVATFKSQATQAGITDPKQITNPNLAYLSDLSRKLLGRAPTLQELAETQGMTDQQIRQWVNAQPHPIYPHQTAGDIQAMTDRASIYSSNYAGRMPHVSEVSRLLSLNAGPGELRDFYSHQNQTQTHAESQLQAQQEQSNVLPMKGGRRAS